MKKWNKQSEKDLYNEPVDWADTYYKVILTDLTEKTVVTYADETADGYVNTYCHFLEDDGAVDFDNILLWRKILKKTQF